MNKVKYGIMLPNGNLAGYREMDSYYFLTDIDSWPEWLVDEPGYVAATIFTNHEGYGDENHPGWGRLTREQMRPAKVVTVVTITDEVVIPTNIDCWQNGDLKCRAIPWQLAKFYTKRKDLEDSKNYILAPTRVLLSDAIELVGKVVCFDNNVYSGHVVVAAIQPPEEYTGMGAESFLICDSIGKPPNFK